MTQRLLFLCLALLVFLPAPAQPCLCLLLGAAYKCPQPPTCCESGWYALDECGCCKKCAKAELQTCGGASGISGRCGDGLQCLKTCLPCNTVGDSGSPCIFPFKYLNQTYESCTTKDSDTRQPWCATAVDTDGHVIDYAWGDCAEGCPGTRLECDERYFSIEEGTCIDVSVPGAIPNWFGAPKVKLEPATEVLFPAPVCKNKGPQRFYANTCRCDRGETALDFDLQGLPRGNCTGLDGNLDDNLDKVWCFLENIRDPQDPRSGCYSDTQWSARDGRYWSALACSQDPDVDVDGDPSSFGTQTFRPNLPQVRSRPNPGPTRPQRPPTTTTTPRPTTTTTERFSEEPRHRFGTKTTVGFEEDGLDEYSSEYAEVFNYNYDSSYDNENDYIEDYEEEDYPEYALAPAPAPTTPQPKRTTFEDLDQHSFTLTADLETEIFKEAATAASTLPPTQQWDEDSYVFTPEIKPGNV